METRSKSRGNVGQTNGSSYSSRKLAQIYLMKWVAAFSFGILHTFLVNLFYKHVPDPYMDEIFHVNQTREYCNGNFTYWNQMITTPPLIYVIAAWTGFCGRERFLNSAIIPLTFVGLTRLRLSRSTRNNFQDAILCSIAILLLPVLFETSILFYTDLLSLTLVIYGLGTSSPTLAALIFTFSVFSRQTNIVWAAFYCLCNLQNEFDAKKPFTSTFRCVLRHRAFAVLGFGFLLFMFTNNGVVLGDRTAHRMHFHLPQLFYFALFTLSSSAPLVLQYWRPVLRHVYRNFVIYMFIGLLMVPAVHRFSYEHPYLLADNRHFTFYIWRRWFLKDPIYKFVTIPFYIVSFAFIYVALKHVRLFTLLCGVIAACLCLIPAHLVEFRYYIIPYTIVRINFQQNNTLLVCLEILAHVVVNFFTIDLFLNRPFVWANEPENVQRFMCLEKKVELILNTGIRLASLWQSVCSLSATQRFSTTMFFSISVASSWGGRNYMEDRMVIERLVDDQNNLIGVFLAILDGHGGAQACEHVQRVLWPTIKDMDGFMSQNDSDVLNAMKKAFLKIHNEMKVEAVNWPERRSGHPSTAGTTCSCAFIRDERIYVAHVGDSRIVLVGNEEASFVDLTNDHKPELPSEEDRIVRAGGSITKSSSVARVNWKRPRSCHSDIYDTIAFLSLSRSLGDYWSYNETTETYIVSPEPECTVHVINNERDKVLVLVSDGITHAFTSEKIAQLINGYQNCPVRNFAQHLLHEAVVRWGSLKADNMSVLCVGLHQDDEQTFNDDSESAIDCSIDEHLIINPQDIVRLYSSRLCSTTLANDGPQFYKQEKPESSQSDSSRTSVRTCNLSEMNASLDDYMISKKRTLTASDEDSELVRSFCTPVRNGIHQRPLPLVPTFDWKVESQQRSPTEPCSRLIVDFLSDEGTPAKKPRVLKEL